MSETTWIRGKGRSGIWHLAKPHELRGTKTGNVMHRTLVTACNGTQLGGPWGYETSAAPTTEHVCARCASLSEPKR
jgi:hypothetical protein